MWLYFFKKTVRAKTQINFEQTMKECECELKYDMWIHKWGIKTYCFGREKMKEQRQI